MPAVSKGIARRGIEFGRARLEYCFDAAATKATTTTQESDRTEGWDAGPIGSAQARVANSGTSVGTLLEQGALGVRHESERINAAATEVATHLACSEPRRVF